MLSGGISADPILENNDWKTISKVARVGKAAEFWNIGDKKVIKIDGVNYNARIIGFDHDDVVNQATYRRAKAGITFDLERCLITNYPMKTVKTNSGGWGNTDMKKTTLPNILSTFESDLQSAIVEVKKPYLSGYYLSSVTISNDKLFLLSENELFGSNPHVNAAEGNQYAYYAAGKSKYKYNQTGYWWLRSIPKTSDIYFCGIDNSGQVNVYLSPTDGYSVSFAFCV